MWYRWEVFKLNPFEEKEVREWSGLCDESCELISVEGDGVRIVLTASFNVIGDRRQYSSSHMSQYSVLEMVVRVKIKK